MKRCRRVLRELPPHLPLMAGMLVYSSFCGCGSQAAESVRFPTIRDSSGVTIVENASEVNGSKVECASSVEAVLGQALGPEGTLLFGVGDVVRLSDGRIVVGNSGTGELRYYSADGVFLTSIGALGEGPGEFRAISSLSSLPGDSVLAYDRWQRRISVFAPDGSLARVLSIQQHVYPHLPSEVSPLSDGRYLGLSWLSGRKKPIQPPGLYRDTTVVLLYGPSGDLISMVGKLRGEESYMPKESNGGVAITPAFGREAFWEPLPDGFFLASNDEYSINRFSSEGHMTMAVRMVAEPVEVTPAVRKKAVTEVESRRSVPRPPWFSEEMLFDDEVNPESIPMFEGLVAEADGAFWIGTKGGGVISPNVWRRFSPSGIFTFSVEFPRDFRLLTVDEGLAIGIKRDEYDVEYVVVRRIGPCTGN